MFYNDEKKKEYIEETKENTKTYKQVMTATFNNTLVMENKLNKDISEFSKEEVLEFYRSLNTTSMERLLILDNNLKRYAKWATKDNFEYKDINIDDIRTCTNERDNIISKEELLDEISILPNISDQFLCLALFEGIGGTGYNELVDLKINAFEKVDMDYYVHLPKRDLKVSEFLVQLATDSAMTDRLFMYAEGLSFIEREYQKSDKIIKDLPMAFSDNERTKSIRIQSKLIRIQQYLGNPAITKTGLFESGRVNMIKEFAKEDNETDFNEVIRKHDDEITHRYGKIRVKKRWIEQYEKYLRI